MSEFETTLPDWAVTELRRPVHGASAERERIMERVRVAQPPRRRAQSAAFQPRWFRRGVLSPTGAAVAAGLTMLVSLVSLPRTNSAPANLWAEATVIGDTVVSEPVTSRLATAIADTLRIVRFALRVPSASRVALSGDFNKWDSNSTWLTHDEKTGMWIARLAVPRSAKRFAFVVDGGKWFGAPTPHRAAVDSVALSPGLIPSI